MVSEKPTSIRQQRNQAIPYWPVITIAIMTALGQYLGFSTVTPLTFLVSISVALSVFNVYNGFEILHEYRKVKEFLICMALGLLNLFGGWIAMINGAHTYFIR